MSIYLNAFLMLAATIAAFVLLAKALQIIRSRRLIPSWRPGGPAPAVSSRLTVEQTCMVDSKRRLLLIRSDEQRVLLLTGGPADLLVLLPPTAQIQGTAP